MDEIFFLLLSSTATYFRLCQMGNPVCFWEGTICLLQLSSVRILCSAICSSLAIPFLPIVMVRYFFRLHMSRFFSRKCYTICNERYTFISENSCATQACLSKNQRCHWQKGIGIHHARCQRMARTTFQVYQYLLHHVQKILIHACAMIWQSLHMNVSQP